MSEARQTVLLVCHVSAMEMAAEAARQAWGPDAEIDILAYGRASPDLPSPPGTNLIEVPVGRQISSRAVLHMVAKLTRMRPYTAVALSQPMLAFSRARGPLVAFALLVGRRRAVILDPGVGRIVAPITLRLAVADVARWIALQAVSIVSARAAAAVLVRLPEAEIPYDPARLGGSVLYLRTDIELRVAPLKSGGSVAHTEGILSALLRRGHQVAFWCSGDMEGVPSSIPQRRITTLLVGNLPTEIAELISGLVQGLNPPRGFRPTGFIYQRYSLNNLAAVILSHRWRVPLVLEANSSEAKWRRDFSVLRYPRLATGCERLILRRASVVSTVSANAAEDLLAAGAPPGRLRVIPNGVNVEHFSGAAPQPLSTPAGALVICFVGLFYPWHGVRYLADAFALLHQRRPDVRLLLVGDGEEAPVARSRLERQGALAATHFAGLVSRTEAARYMAAADILVSPHANVHRFIGSPIKLFEYMAAGKAIVASRVAQIEQVLRDGETALLVEPENSQALGDALERLCADPKLRLRLGQAARQEARERHSWDARLAALLGDAPPTFDGRS